MSVTKGWAGNNWGVYTLHWTTVNEIAWVIMLQMEGITLWTVAAVSPNLSWLSLMVSQLHNLPTTAYWELCILLWHTSVICNNGFGGGIILRTHGELVLLLTDQQDQLYMHGEFLFDACTWDVLQWFHTLLILHAILVGAKCTRAATEGNITYPPPRQKWHFSLRLALVMMYALVCWNDVPSHSHCPEQLFLMIVKRGVFPQVWKVVQVTPIHNKEPTTSPSNYRSISV